jgi:hypothetical protein
LVEDGSGVEKTAEFTSGQVSGPSARARTEERRGSDRRRRAGHGEELRTELKLARQQRRTFAILAALLLVSFLCLTVWSLREQSILGAVVSSKQERIAKLTEQLASTTTALEESRLAVDSLVNHRIPGLLPFRVDEPVEVDTRFVQELSFKPAAPPIFGHECKLVVENDSNSEIRPALSVILFNDVGFELARAQLTDGLLDELRVGEIRSFFATLEIAEGSVPKYFLVSSE